MPTPSVSSVVRDILSKSPGLTADEVIQRVKARGLAASAATVRASVHNIRSALKKVAGRTPPVPAEENPAEAAPAARPTPAPAAAQTTAPAPLALAAVLANVALVNKVLGLCGGAENARQAAEAVRACGSVDDFLQHLDLVAGIRGPAGG